MAIEPGKKLKRRFSMPTVTSKDGTKVVYDKESHPQCPT
jgi:hypothetical protein